MKYKKQSGVVLLVAIILLLVITIIGITAVNSSSIKTQVAGNSIFSMLVYQGAESALAKSTNFKNAVESVAMAPNDFVVSAEDLQDEAISGGASLKSNARIKYEGIFDCPITSGRITSTTVKCRVFKVDANSRIEATNARSHHIKGIAFDSVLSLK